MNRDFDNLLLSFNFLVEKLSEHDIKIDKSEMKRYCIDKTYEYTGMDRLDILFNENKKASTEENLNDQYFQGG